MLRELSDDEEFQNADIYISPPSNQVTDEDSGPEDAMDISNFSGAQLRAAATVTIKSTSVSRKIIGDTFSSSDSDEPAGFPSKKRRKKTQQEKTPVDREWATVDLPTDGKSRFSWDVPKPGFLNFHWSPTTIFEQFIGDDMLELMAEQSTQYARQKFCKDFSVTREELKLFLAILLTSGYVEVPNRRLYWDPSIDVKNVAISSAMPRNRFDQILQHLHFADNRTLDKKDKLAKLRPFFTMLNEKFLFYYPKEQQMTIDERMVPYFGRHGGKKSIRGKPFRFGYKVWCLNTKLGYLVQFRTFQGAGKIEKIDGLGMGGSVVMDLISELPEDLPYDLYFDNLFTSPALIDHLSEKGIGGTGIVSPTRTKKCPFEGIETFKNEERGSFSYQYDKKQNLILVRWNDKHIVTMGSNRHGVYPLTKAKRWSKAGSKIVEIDQPNIIAQYNRCMRGIEHADQNLDNYRCSIRSKKWWWTLFLFGLESAVQNAWQIYRLCPSSNTKPLDILNFRREICLTYFKACPPQSSPARHLGKPKKCRVLESIRYDGLHHYIEVNKTQIRCANCGNKVTRKCSKCMVGLHEKCFKEFHSKY